MKTESLSIPEIRAKLEAHRWQLDCLTADERAALNDEPLYTEDSYRKHALYVDGQTDRKNGKGCLSANGAYLNGWYAPDAGPYYLPEKDQTQK